MLLYILYIEPLLLYLERNLHGINVCGIHQKLESYCNDVNVMTEHLEDVVKVDIAVQGLGFGEGEQTGLWIMYRQRKS